MPGDHVTAHAGQFLSSARAPIAIVDALHQAADARTVLQHVVTATDIGCFVAMLCSPLSIGVHGEAIGIDGRNRIDMHY